MHFVGPSSQDRVDTAHHLEPAKRAMPTLLRQRACRASSGSRNDLEAELGPRIRHRRWTFAGPRLRRRPRRHQGRLARELTLPDSGRTSRESLDQAEDPLAAAGIVALYAQHPAGPLPGGLDAGLPGHAAPPAPRAVAEADPGAGADGLPGGRRGGPRLRGIGPGLGHPGSGYAEERSDRVFSACALGSLVAGLGILSAGSRWPPAGSCDPGGGRPTRSAHRGLLDLVGSAGFVSSS